ncbi:hypothetical protein [Stutzerimonas nitrititolerans]|uniref:hypothetical protein n=1 Tax=Stutzerimonas nitrititolerans TaxID=2482751 RepID=UPI0028B0B691|nr:hypothetical protein [Stutzerimonas nitrititolerans]
MQEFKYDRVHTPAAQEAARQEIARKMEAFEAEHGPVETLPIRIGDKVIPYVVSCPEKRAAQAPRRRARNAGLGKGYAAKMMRANNIKRVREAMRPGMSASELARQVGLTRPTVASILREIGEMPKPAMGTKQARDRAVLREVWP